TFCPAPQVEPDQRTNEPRRQAAQRIGDARDVPPARTTAATTALLPKQAHARADSEGDEIAAQAGEDEAKIEPPATAGAPERHVPAHSAPQPPAAPKPCGQPTPQPRTPAPLPHTPPPPPPPCPTQRH